MKHNQDTDPGYIPVLCIQIFEVPVEEPRCDRCSFSKTGWCAYPAITLTPSVNTCAVITEDLQFTHKYAFRQLKAL